MIDERMRETLKHIIAREAALEIVAMVERAKSHPAYPGRHIYEGPALTVARAYLALLSTSREW